MEESTENTSTTQAGQDNTMLVLTHLMPLAGAVIPGIGFLAPLIWWLLMKDKSAELNIHGKEVLNFVISLALYSVVGGMLVFVIIGIFLLFALGIAGLVLMIMGAIKASKGELYHYPFILRLIK